MMGTLRANRLVVHGTVMFLLLVVAFLFHSYNLSFSSYDLDEAVHIWHAQKSYSEVVEQASNDPNPPIYNLIISSWVKEFGVGEGSTRLFSVMMGVLGVLLVYVIAARNFGLALAVLAALFYCFSPVQYRFTHLARPYSMLMVTVILSYGLLLECLRHPSRWKLLLYYLATTLMIYVHPTSIFNVAAQGLIILLHQRKNLKAVLRLAFPLVGAVASFGIWMLSIPYFERDDAMWFGAPSWADVWYVIQVLYGSEWVVYAHLVLMGLLSVRLFSRTESLPPNSWMILVWAVLPFVVSIVFSHLFKPVFQDKYILSVQPALMLLLAITISQFGAWLNRIVTGIGILVLLLIAVRYEPYSEGDWKNAVAYVQEHREENGRIFVDPWYEFRTFSYYYDRHIFETPDSTEKLLTFDGVHWAWHDIYENGQAKCDALYVLSGHENVNDTRVDFALLDTAAVLVDEKMFTGVKLRSYRFLKD
ncbi:MAG: hypothetical protein RL266_414 [Bacteroidota bacterium]|jgi:4-amino-4-deoxy-L-arabinose transferase-like glycosyltransferase